MRGAPAALRLDDVTPEGDLAEDARHSRRLVAPAQVSADSDGIAGGVKAAAAVKTRHRVDGERLGETILLTAAACEHRFTHRPSELMQDGAEP